MAVEADEAATVAGVDRDILVDPVWAADTMRRTRIMLVVHQGTAGRRDSMGMVAEGMNRGVR